MSEVYVFHGIDGKVGTTMVSQSVAEAFAEAMPEKRVLFTALNGRESMDYAKGGADSLDALKSRLESAMLEVGELVAHCRGIRNLFMIGGIRAEEEERYYGPELSTRLLAVARRCFDIIVADSGNRLDNGLALGALLACENRFLVLTQQESALSRWERRRPVFAKLGIMPAAYVLNSYMDGDVYSSDYVAERIGTAKGELHRVSFSGLGRQAEIQRKTLWAAADRAFSDDVANLAHSAAGGAFGLDALRKRRKRWKIGFI
ncbi:MAG: hypothetical protein LBS32_03830 [Clostridiales Family XIII bacterium]|jgi:hypothetical protein|nr:hypothetical protein [Clostridiales Family XIII bacterium]